MSDFESMLGKPRTQSGTIAASSARSESPGDESRKCNDKDANLDPMDYASPTERIEGAAAKTHGRRED